MTLQKAYRLAQKQLEEMGIDSATLDTQVLICNSLNISLEKFFLKQNDELSPAALEKIKIMINRRAQNQPIAYILGHKEFFGLDFLVNQNVLIPRPETERLVELALDRIKHHEESIKNKKSLIHDLEYLILDVGTGCGNIIIALAKNTNGQFFASDISVAALKVAQKNAMMHHVDDKIKFIQSDLFSNIKNQKFDLILANLPYVPTADLDEKSIRFEPQKAIFAQDNGAEIIKKFLGQAPAFLNKNGLILLELDPRNAMDIKNYTAKYFPKTKIKLSKDLAGLWRYLSIEN